jgi:NADH-quinone oxidoreductase subunit N
MFSLTGLPPLAGFVAKFNIFYAAINKKLYTLVLIGAITSVISLYFYAKVIRFMFFNPVESDAPIGGFKFINQTVIVTLTIPLLFLGIFWSGLFSSALGSKIFFIQ